MQLNVRTIRALFLSAVVGALGVHLGGCASAPAPMAAPTVTAREARPAPATQPAPEPTPAQAPGLDTIRAGEFDNGKMWTFEYPPLDYLQRTYGFSVEADWFRRAHLSALRIPGCSASFVSPAGLVMTNHHCAREAIEQVSLDGEDLVADGFWAGSLEDERPIPDAWADQLVEIRDVTDRVYAALEEVRGAERRAQRRGEITEEILEEIIRELGGEDAGYNVEMVELYAGGRYSAYIFRRYDDVRLVMSPELQVAYFGGDWDNFTYPRYDLDVTFYRVYGEDGAPLRSEHYFPFNPTGIKEGDMVFVIGNPGSTSRLQTVAELEYRRDVSDQAILDLLNTRVVALQEFAEAHPEKAREMDLRNTIFSFLNSLKAYTGIVAGLHDPVILAKRRDNEGRFQAAIEADPALRGEYGTLMARMAEIQERKREFAPEFSSFLAVGHPTLGSSTMGRAFAAYQYLSARRQGVPEETLEGIREMLAGTPEQPRAINEAQLAQRFQGFVRYFGLDHPFVQEVLEGRSPEGAAAVIMSRSALADSASTAEALSRGTLSLDDPAVRVAQAVIQRLGPAQQLQASVGAEEEEIASALGRALFAIHGTDIPPDATFSPRIADGVVKSYEYNGTMAPVLTTYYGMYDRHRSFGPETDWDLPHRWKSPPEGFDLSTPLNFVSTADIIGGNSGSPVIDRDLRVVGLIFDGNIESLSGDYIYQPETNRAVAVDVRGILEALRVIYEAHRLVDELLAGQPMGVGGMAPRP
jgi:hypothetical protein